MARILSFQITPRKQNFLRIAFWFSIYGLLVTVIFNVLLWILTGPLLAYLPSEAFPSGFQNASGVFLEKFKAGFLGLSAFFGLLLIGAYGALKAQTWAMGLTCLLLVLSLLAVALAVGFILYWQSPLSALLGSIYWWMMGILTLTGVFCGWVLFQLLSPVNMAAKHN
jgi:hypothetical protein